MEIINEIDNIHNIIVELIDDCENSIYWFAFNLDITYNTKIYNSLMNALDRNIKIYIITSGINPYKIIIKHPNLFVKNQIHICDKSDDISLKYKKLFNLDVGNNNYMFVNHLRFIYNGKKLILGGCNSSSRYNGSHFNIIKNNNFTWYEHGILLNLPNQNDYFYNLFSNINLGCKYVKIKDLNVKNDVTITLSNKKQYEYILDCIKKSKNEIYIENQYFFSNEKYTNNLICKALINRINTAIINNEEFRLKMIISYYNYDETETVQSYMNTMTQESLIYLRNSINCDYITFNKYVTIYIPTDKTKIVVHSKVFLFDDTKLLYSTCNICDRSFYKYGDMEMGIIIENEFKVKKIKTQLQNNFYSSKFLFSEFNFVFDTCKLLTHAIVLEFFNTISNYHKKNTFLYYLGVKLPLHPN
jgi:phosphatidylserine/phosphatidylglycerophosphate/cardiolipin synthase-like enzyme